MIYELSWELNNIIDLNINQVEIHPNCILGYFRVSVLVHETNYRLGK